MKRQLYTGSNYKKSININDLERIAKKRLPNFVFEYVYGGSDDEHTLHHNRTVFDQYLFEPRTMTKVGTRDLSTTLFDRSYQMPVAIGPTGFNGMLTRDGDRKLACAARDANIPFVLSNVSTTAMEDIQAIEGLTAWMQLYFYRDRAFVKSLIKRCQDARFEAIVITTDSAIYGNREWDVRNFRRPMKPTFANLAHMMTKPRWMLDVLLPGLPTFKNLDELLPPEKRGAQGASQIIGSQLDPSLNWEDIAWLRETWPGKIILKGILAPEEAEQAVKLGVDGIVLSNHGGRQLNHSLSPMDTLADVKACVGERCHVFVDSGFRRGTDIIKALALGADAVWLGRATLYGLAAGGQAGAEHALNLLRGEVDRTLGLLGHTNIKDLTSACLVKRPR